MISTFILLENTNMTSFFRFVNKTVVYFFHQLDFLVVKANVDELSSARIYQDESVGQLEGMIGGPPRSSPLWGNTFASSV
jgi:hypothetical protein